MQNEIYVPVLKWQAGEQAALKQLFENQKESIIPLLEINSKQSPEKILESLTSCFNHPIYIDTARAEKNKRDYLINLVSFLAESNQSVYPVLYHKDIPDISQELIGVSNRIAIKVPFPEAITGPTTSDIIATIENYHNENKQVLIDIIFDLGVVLKERDSALLLAGVKDAIRTHLIEKAFFNKIIICVSSFPDKLDVESGKTVDFERFDIGIFRNIIKDDGLKDIRSHFVYGDYGVNKFTETELDFSMMKYGILPKIKYTTEDKYVVLKGKRDKAGVMIISYKDLVRKIVNSDYYYGEAFSFGDNDIKLRSIGKKGPGNSTNWVTTTANHHIAVVINQLSR